LPDSFHFALSTALAPPRRHDAGDGSWRKPATQLPARIVTAGSRVCGYPPIEGETASGADRRLAPAVSPNGTDRRRARGSGEAATKPLSQYSSAPPSGSAEIASTGAYGQGAGRAASPATAVAGGEETISLAEEQLEVGKRTVDRSTTRIRRYVVETPVEREVTLRGERVTIERRRPLGAQEGVGPGAFEERTVEVRETEEVPVAQKTAHVTEEVVVHREDTERTETVRDTVRREEVEVIPGTKSPDDSVR
jgi:uncharacterized protein (TIGR02271 family)